MGWIDELVDRLAERFDWPYHSGGPGAAEPTALAALVLAAHDRVAAAGRAAAALVAMQHPGGSVGITTHQSRPRWPTGLAVVAWLHVQQVTGVPRAEPIDQAIDFLTQLRGRTTQRQPHIGHNPELTGWPWVEGTHSWLEPTIFGVLALKAIGRAGDPRVREGVRLLIDRQLPGGGCNYGNTFVFQQRLLAHHQPTGLALIALSDEPPHPRIEASRAFLQRAWPTITGSASQCFAALGLAAMQATPVELQADMRQLYDRQIQTDGSPYRLALLGLAAMGANSPLLPRRTQLQPPGSTQVSSGQGSEAIRR